MDLIDVLDEEGKWHRAVHLYLFDQSQRLLLQKRSNHVDHYPGVYSISLTGHVDAGESSYAALQREIQEELGINAQNLRIDFLFSFKQKMTLSPSYIDNQFNDVYACFHNFHLKGISFDQRAITELTLVSLDEFAKNALTKRFHF